MKAIIVFFLLLASVFFLPSSTLARQLLQKGGVTGCTSNPNIPCYPPPKRACPIYIRNC
ncbi:hypothetical protein AAZX31_08G328500 [Glycine max]|uniref:Uncharacterized protein n=1 Tax=Glycine max TaxID=3847 RepID=C6T2Z7_SOYBN|nr:unknown [Glycine max]KAH1054421.1 hypothetical protein GYH30_023274 [Glycine max]KRH46521.1 hypothetical protein GLYMA_08G339500v4 [Glycine max]